jgi:hypothetical protein
MIMVRPCVPLSNPANHLPCNIDMLYIDLLPLFIEILFVHYDKLKQPESGNTLILNGV